MKLPQLLTPRGRKPSASSLSLPLPAAEEPAADSPRSNGGASTPRRLGSLRKLVSTAGRLLTPRGGRARGEEGQLAGSPFDSPRPGSSDAQRTQAYTPSLTGLMEQQLRLSGQLTTPRRHPALESADSDAGSDTASESGSDLSSLDGFGDYARRMGPLPGSAPPGGEEACPEGSVASSSPSDQLDDLP